MRDVFENYLKNGLSEYDSKYLTTYQYVMLLSKNNHITPYVANDDYIYFIEYPISSKEYHGPLEVLESEKSLCGSEAGIIYENIDGQFQTIAFIDSKGKNQNCRK